MEKILNSVFEIIQIAENENGSFVLKLNKETLDIINGLLRFGLRIIFLSIVMYITIRIGNKIINKFVQKQVESKTSFSLNPQKAVTIGEVLKSVLKYLVYILGFSGMFFDLFSKIPLAVASAAGFTIGLGAQTLIKDIINGFFILFEDQYGVGDHITLANFTGIVESIGIRTTVLRDFTGDIHMIPNGSVLEVTNHSRGDIRFLVDIEIAYEENIDKAIEIITMTNKKFQEEYKDDLRGDIDVLGVTSLNASGVNIRVIGRSKPLKQWDMERLLRKDLKIALTEFGIEIPYPKTQIVMNH